MNKRQKVIVFTALGVFLALVALIVILIVQNANGGSGLTDEQKFEIDSLRNANEQLVIANEQMALTNQFNEIDAAFLQYEEQQKYLKNDSLVQQYNEAKQKVETLLKELNQEKKNNSRNRQKIKDLEAEISTLKEILKHYLEEIDRLSKENEGLKKEIEETKQQNAALTSRVATTSRDNEQLAATVKLAKKLNITGLTLQAYNKKGKNEKNITKAKQLGVHFTVSPNNTAAPGMKDFYIRIVSPEGSLLGNGGNFSFDGNMIGCTAHRQLEYDNGELPVTIYWNVNTTLTPGQFTVEVFCDGYRLDSRKFTLTK